MKAVVLDEERRLALQEVPDPTPGEGQTLVEVRAAGVNYADVLIREGRYPQAPPLPSSDTSTVRHPLAAAIRTLAALAPACLTTLVSASETTK